MKICERAVLQNQLPAAIAASASAASWKSRGRA